MSTSPSTGEAAALQKLAPLSGRYLPWTSSAVRPQAMVILLNDVVVNGRRILVECGGGISTVYFARMLAEIGDPSRRLYSIDNDADWLAVLRQMLAAEGLEDWVCLVHAPLTPTPLAHAGGTWFDTQSLNAAFADVAKVDLLFVDGPPAWAEESQQARRPAAAYFKSRLGDRWSVFLDDIDRRGERLVVQEWKRILGEKFSGHEEANIAFSMGGSAFTIC